MKLNKLIGKMNLPEEGLNLSLEPSFNRTLRRFFSTTLQPRWLVLGETEFLSLFFARVFSYTLWFFHLVFD